MWRSKVKETAANGVTYHQKKLTAYPGKKIALLSESRNSALPSALVSRLSGNRGGLQITTVSQVVR